MVATAGAGIAVLLATLWAYNLDERMVSDTVTGAVINTAAAVAAMGFFGGFDMIFTIWQFLRNQEAERARNREREEELKAREEEIKAREDERKAREEIMAMLRAEHQRSETLTARVLELSELAIQRANGNETDGNTASERGE